MALILLVRAWLAVDLRWQLRSARHALAEDVPGRALLDRDLTPTQRGTFFANWAKSAVLIAIVESPPA